MPEDFKALVSGLGEGCFGASLYMRNPCSGSECLRLSRAAMCEWAQLLETTAENSGIALYPEGSGFITLASFDRQIFLFRLENGKPGSVIWWNSDLETTTNLDMSFSQFLLKLYEDGFEGEELPELRAALWQNHVYVDDFHDPARGEDRPFFTPYRKSR